MISAGRFLAVIDCPWPIALPVCITYSEAGAFYRFFSFVVDTDDKNAETSRNAPRRYS